jgi:hypothetical protein
VRGDEKLAARRKSPILDEERNLAFIRRKPEAVLVLVADQIEARESGTDIEPRQPESVIVIPERGRFLVVLVPVDLLHEGRSALREPGREPSFRLAIALRLHVTAMQMRDEWDPAGWSRLRVRRVDGAVDRKQVRQRAPVRNERIRPTDGRRLAATHVEGRPGIGAVVAPERRLERSTRVRIDEPDPAAELPGGDLVMRRPGNGRRTRRARQPVHELWLPTQVEQPDLRLRSGGPWAERRQDERRGE